MNGVYECDVCGGWTVGKDRALEHMDSHQPPVSIGSPQAPREPQTSEDYAFLLANVRDAVGEDE